jgi:undecaprenyl-diphosphatase
MQQRSTRVAWAAWLLGSAMSCSAGGIDHRLDFDQSGIWQRHYQQGLLDTLIVGEVAGALWEGGDNELGRTFWQSIDSSALAGVSSQALKYAFTRARPIQGNNPHLWFQGTGHYSFPSGEVTGVTSIVAPFMLEYGPQHPLVYALAALPLYDGVARMKSQAHWQTDILASLALGTATAYYAHQRESPLILGVLPHGFEVGFKASW